MKRTCQDTFSKVIWNKICFLVNKYILDSTIHFEPLISQISGRLVSERNWCLKEIGLLAALMKTVTVAPLHTSLAVGMDQ